MLSRLFNNAVDELCSFDDLQDELMLVEPSPMLLRSLGELEDHRQGSSAGAAALGSFRAVSNGRESRFDRVGGSDVDPVVGGEIVEGKQYIFVIAQAGAGSWKFWFVQLEEEGPPGGGWPSCACCFYTSSSLGLGIPTRGSDQ